jgi:hypothetical protein
LEGREKSAGLKHYVKLANMTSENFIQPASSRQESACGFDHGAVPSLGPTPSAGPKGFQQQSKLPGIGQSAILDANQQILLPKTSEDCVIKTGKGAQNCHTHYTHSTKTPYGRWPSELRLAPKQ